MFRNSKNMNVAPAPALAPVPAPAVIQFQAPIQISNPKVFDRYVDDPVHFSVFYLETIIFSFGGIFLGFIIDMSFTKIYEAIKQKWKKANHKLLRLLIAFVQISFSALVLFVLWRLTQSTEFVTHWQSTIPGLSFPAFFFGIQSNIYGALQSFYL